MPFYGDPALIPPFDDDGLLPPGLHLATLREVAARFGQASELRRVQMESIGWMHDTAKRAGALRVVINGRRQLEVTREKLRVLERAVDEIKRDPSGTAHTRELTLRSLKGLINQLKEEIVRRELQATGQAASREE